jgi:hypothetical protein
MSAVNWVMPSSRARSASRCSSALPTPYTEFERATYASLEGIAS